MEIRQTNVLITNEMKIGSVQCGHLRGFVHTLKGQACLYFHIEFTNAANVSHVNCKYILRNLFMRNNFD